MSSEDCDVFELEYVASHISDTSSYDHTSKKVTDAVTTPYEYSKLLGQRAKQLASGAPPNVSWNGPFDPIAIAKLEISQRVVPMRIERRIYDAKQPCGYRVEEWDLKDMDVRDV